MGSIKTISIIFKSEKIYKKINMYNYISAEEAIYTIKSGNRVFFMEVHVPRIT